MFHLCGNNSTPKWHVADAVLGQVVLRAVGYMWPIESQEANQPYSDQFNTVTRPGYRWRLLFKPYNLRRWVLKETPTGIQNRITGRGFRF